MSKIPDILRDVKVIITKPSDGSDPFPFAPTTVKERRLGRTRSTIGRELPDGSEYRVASHTGLLSDPSLPISREVYMPVRQAFLDNFGLGDVSERQIVDDERAQFELYQSTLNARRQLKRERQSALDDENARIAEKRDQYMRINARAAQLQSQQLIEQRAREKTVSDAIQASLDAELAEKKAKESAALAEQNAEREAEEAQKAALVAEEERRRQQEAEEARRKAEEERRRIEEEEAKRLAEEEFRRLSEEKELQIADAKEKIENDKNAVIRFSEIFTETIRSMELQKGIFTVATNKDSDIIEAVTNTISLYEKVRNRIDEWEFAVSRIEENSGLANVDSSEYLNRVRRDEGAKIDKINEIYDEAVSIGQSFREKELEAKRLLREQENEERRLLRDKQNIDKITLLDGLLERNLESARNAKEAYDNQPEKNELVLRQFRSTVADQYNVAIGHQNEIIATLDGMRDDYEPVQFEKQSAEIRLKVQQIVDAIKSIVDESTKEESIVDEGEVEGGADEGLPAQTKYNFRSRHK
jgi:hypothetical protein